jgi:hypothetical protein
MTGVQRVNTVPSEAKAMRYALVSSRMKAGELVLLGAGFALINLLLLPLLGGFFLLVDMAILAGLAYRTYDYLYTAHAVALETAEAGIVLEYDKGFQRRLPYRSVRGAEAIPMENKPYYHVLIYLKSADAVAGDNRRRARFIDAEPGTAARIVQDVRERAGIAGRKGEGGSPARPRRPAKKAPAGHA